MSLEVRVLPIGTLRPARYNPRKVLKPTDAAYRRLRASLEEFGLVEPLIWNELTGHVVGGHARLRILKELGYTEVPVSVVRLDAAKEKALNVVLNNHEAQGRYDPTKLEKLLTQLEGLPEFGLTGFDSRTLTNLRLEPVAEFPPEVVADRVEVTLVTDPATWERLEGRLDELVRE
ncbi:MAG TPA: ParB N-terminal domain-containing protein, partial [Fimbriiglobus sp.]|nr:ParB N-terminal domain-containing protein [Fimbriiglobus sp.]